jgi:beta-glucosidase/6-phospho-beta-glucosidase/beta-galactosidase
MNRSSLSSLLRQHPASSTQSKAILYGILEEVLKLSEATAQAEYEVRPESIYGQVFSAHRRYRKLYITE